MLNRVTSVCGDTQDSTSSPRWDAKVVRDAAGKTKNKLTRSFVVPRANEFAGPIVREEWDPGDDADKLLTCMLKAASPECVIAILVGSTWKYKGGSWALTGEGTNDEKVETAKLTHDAYFDNSTDAPVNYYGSRALLISTYRVCARRVKRTCGAKDQARTRGAGGLGGYIAGVGIECGCVWTSPGPFVVHLLGCEGSAPSPVFGRTARARHAYDTRHVHRRPSGPCPALASFLRSQILDQARMLGGLNPRHRILSTLLTLRSARNGRQRAGFSPSVSERTLSACFGAVLAAVRIGSDEDIVRSADWAIHARVSTRCTLDGGRCGGLSLIRLRSVLAACTLMIWLRTSPTGSQKVAPGYSP
ncbi:hypothetical protein C8J57DRAFT_1254162 [Mycena rebaudengoi]|nr:hypothetical protein C8J57DRAFT_1254162 [Mycena rebaudengoi]